MLRELVEIARFLFLALKIYRLARRMEANGGIAYGALEQYGVPSCALFVGTGREAWRVTIRAVEEGRRVF